MRSQKEKEVYHRVTDYLEYIKNEADECINRKMPYTLIDLNYDERYIVYGFETKDWMLNPGGVLHGGMLCTMFDIVMGVTARAFSGYYTPTVNLAVTFLSPIPNNDRVTVTVRATRVGNTFVQLVAEAKSGTTGELSGTASATFYCNKAKIYRNKETGETL